MNEREEKALIKHNVINLINGHYDRRQHIMMNFDTFEQKHTYLRCQSHQKTVIAPEGCQITSLVSPLTIR